MATASADFRNQLDDEFTEEIKGGDYAPTHDFAVNDTLIGTYLRSEEVKTKKGLSTKHTFSVDGEEVDAWGAAILNSRLEQVEPGTRVKVVRRPEKITTSTGNTAWDFGVFVSKRAFAAKAGA